MSSSLVTLRPAYNWDCPACEAENFVRAMVPDLPPDEINSLKESLGVESWEEGDVLMMPKRVTCCGCGASFDTEHF